MSTTSTPTNSPFEYPLNEHARRRLVDIFEAEELPTGRPDLRCYESIDWDDLEAQPIKGVFADHYVPTDPITAQIRRTFFEQPAQPLTWADGMWLNGVLMALHTEAK